MQHLPPTYDDAAPSDALLALVIRSKPRDVHAVIVGLSETQRAGLAVFCNARAHLRDHGRAIAATCSRFSLTCVGGLAGATLFDQAAQVVEPPLVSNKPFCRPVTVARSVREDVNVQGRQRQAS